MELSHLVFAGCSFAYCQGLEIEKAWPTLIAKHFNSNIVNLATPGSGNDNIHRKLYEYVYKNLKFNNKPLVVVAFSDAWRKEVWSKEHYFDTTFNDYAPVSYHNNKPETYHEYAMLENWNDEDFYRKTLLYKLSLANLFQNLEIPYIFTNSFPEYQNLDAHLKIKDKFLELEEAVIKEFFIKDIYKIAIDNKNLPCGHYGEESCQQISQHIIESITTHYPNISFNNKLDYLKLSDYIKLDKYHQKFPEWCCFDTKFDILP